MQRRGVGPHELAIGQVAILDLDNERWLAELGSRRRGSDGGQCHCQCKCGGSHRLHGRCDSVERCGKRIYFVISPGTKLEVVRSQTKDKERKKNTPPAWPSLLLDIPPTYFVLVIPMPTPNATPCMGLYSYASSMLAAIGIACTDRDEILDFGFWIRTCHTVVSK